MNPDTDKLMRLLGKTTSDFGRFRHCWLEDGFIVVHTRCGGGNRENYSKVFDEMRQHPWYSHDQDQDFDYTYADIYFKVPVDADFEGIIKDENPEKQWNELFAALDQQKAK